MVEKTGIYSFNQLIEKFNLQKEIMNELLGFWNIFICQQFKRSCLQRAQQ